MKRSRSSLRLLPLLPLLAAAHACALLPGRAGEERPAREAQAQEELPVVDDTGPFDPAEAVDDDDAPVVELGTEDDPTDQDPFVDEPKPNEGRADGQSPEEERREAEPVTSAGADARDDANDPVAREEPRDEAAGRDEDQRGAEAAEKPPAGTGPTAEHADDEPTRTGTEPGENEREQAAERPDDEHVASPAEVRELEAARSKRLEDLARAGREDDDAKAELASNPPPEPLPEPDPIERAALAWVMEGLLLAAVAGVLTALWRLARHYPKTVGVVTLTGVALIGFFLSQSA